MLHLSANTKSDTTGFTYADHIHQAADLLGHGFSSWPASVWGNQASQTASTIAGYFNADAKRVERDIVKLALAKAWPIG